MNKKVMIWIMIPLAYGIIANTFLFVVSSLFIQIIFAVFWLWVGMEFGKLKIPKVKSFLYGNSLWIVSFLLFIWQFVILDDASRNLLLALVSQYYMFPFLWLGTQFTLLFSDVLHGTTIIFLAYLSMFTIFSFGFLIGLIIEIKTRSAYSR